jgi:hypothetical protein
MNITLLTEYLVIVDLGVEMGLVFTSIHTIFMPSS